MTIQTLQRIHSLLLRHRAGLLCLGLPLKGRQLVVCTPAVLCGSALHFDITPLLPLQAPGILITPHIGGAVRNMRVRGYKLVLGQLDRYLAGEPLENVRVNGY